MKKVGLVGLGDMGIGMAKNIITSERMPCCFLFIEASSQI